MVDGAGEPLVKILRNADALILIYLFTPSLPLLTTRIMPTTKPIEIYAEPRAHQDCDWPTPVRAGLQYIVSFIEAKGIDFTREDVYEFCGVPSSTGADIIASGIPRREAHVLKEITGNKTRGRKKVLSEEQIESMEE